MLRVQIDQDICIGSGLCSFYAPKAFHQDHGQCQSEDREGTQCLGEG